MYQVNSRAWWYPGIPTVSISSFTSFVISWGVYFIFSFFVLCLKCKFEIYAAVEILTFYIQQIIQICCFFFSGGGGGVGGKIHKSRTKLWRFSHFHEFFVHVLINRMWISHLFWHHIRHIDTCKLCSYTIGKQTLHQTALQPCIRFLK